MEIVDTLDTILRYTPIEFIRYSTLFVSKLFYSRSIKILNNALEQVDSHSLLIVLCKLFTPDNDMTLFTKFGFSDKYLKDILCAFASYAGNLCCLKYANNQECLLDYNSYNNMVGTNYLDCLIYVHENGIEWTSDTCVIAAENNYLEGLKYLHENECPWDKHTCYGAAENGSIECLDYAIKNGCDYDNKIYFFAVKYNHVNVIEYAYKQGIEFSPIACDIAAADGNLECLKYLHKIGSPWYHSTVENAARWNRLDCLKYLVENGCRYLNTTTIHAVRGESLECLKYLHNNGCILVPSISAEVGFNGNLDILKYLCDVNYHIELTLCTNAIIRGNFKILKYAHEHGCDIDHLVSLAVEYGELKCLKYIVQNLTQPYNQTTHLKLCTNAISEGYTDMLEYLNDIGIQLGYRLDDYLCSIAIMNDDLYCLKYLYSHGYSVNSCINRLGFNHDNISILKYIHKNGYKIFYDVIISAACGGSIKCIKYIHENACRDYSDDDILKYNILDNETVCFKLYKYIILVGCLKSFIYVHKNGYIWTNYVCSYAAKHGNLDILKYAIENGCPVDEDIISFAVQSGNLDIVDYLYNELGYTMTDKAFAIIIQHEYTHILKYLSILGNSIAIAIIEGKYHLPGRAKYIRNIRSEIYNEILNDEYDYSYSSSD